MTLAARSEGRLVGVLPLQRSFGGLSAAGTGVTDVLLPALDPLAAAPVLDALVAGAIPFLRPGDVLDLQQWPADAPAPTQPPGCRIAMLHQEVCPRLDLADPAAVPRGQERRAAYALRRLERLGGRVRLVRGESELAAAMEALFDLHTCRWQRRLLPGVFRKRDVRLFHAEFAREALHRGLLRLWLLELAGRPIACVYGWAAGGALWHYGGGFDPDLARYSPGTALLGCAIEEARAEGLRRWEFLRGAEPYKARWGALPHVNRRWLIARTDAVSAAVVGLRRRGHALAATAREIWVRKCFR
jgi:CelD/BcsL family acetyltransferase involved in cellulose biosynthesis